jgi:hypothetical protein
MNGGTNSTEWGRESLRAVWHLWFVFIWLLFAPFALPILFGLFIGRPNCTSWNEISGKRIGWGARGRDRKGVETEELHTWFPPSPWSEAFRAMRVRTSARPPVGPPRGISLTKLPNHACIMRFADQKNTASGKSGTLARQGICLYLPIPIPIPRESAVTLHIFLLED